MLLSFITNNPAFAVAAEAAGIDRIMIDLEAEGKQVRQRGRNLFLSDHTIDDISRIKAVTKKTGLFVRINPIHSESPKEVEAVIRMGADIVMLPFFHTMDEIETFLKLTEGAVLNSLLVETKEAARPCRPY